MTTPEPDPHWVAALIEQRITELTDEDFADLVARTRPPRVPKHPVVPGVGGQPSSDKVARAAVAAAEESGDWATSFALKARQLDHLMRKNP